MADATWRCSCRQQLYTIAALRRMFAVMLTMARRREGGGYTPLALAVQLLLLLLCTCTWGLGQAHGGVPSVLTDELLATPPGNVRTTATEDLFGHPLSNCTLRGPIENAQCNYEQVDAINDDFFAQLQSIVTTPYFRYYKTDLDRECPFWPANSFCTNENCAVQFLDQVRRQTLMAPQF